MRHWIITTLLAVTLAAAGACDDTQQPTATAPTAPTPTTPTTPTTTPQTGAWRGLTIAPEDRCSPYDSDDYRYPQSVEDDIVRDLGGIYSPYTCETFRLRHADRHRAHRRPIRGARLGLVLGRRRHADGVRARPAEPDPGIALAEPLAEERQGRGRVYAGPEPLLVRADGRGCPAEVRADYRSGRGGRDRSDAGGLHVNRDLLQLAQSGTHR